MAQSLPMGVTYMTEVLLSEEVEGSWEVPGEMQICG